MPVISAESTCAPVSRMEGMAAVRFCESCAMISTADPARPGNCAEIEAASSAMISPAA